MNIINLDPVKIIWNVDENNNKVSQLMQPENHVVVNGKITLLQIPDKFNRVTIAGKTEIHDFSSPIDDATKFRVDYSTGIIFLHSSLEGQTITVDRYYGRGMILYPASRIYSKVDATGQVVEVVQGLIDDGRQALEALGGLQQGLIDAEARELSLEQDIATATSREASLESDIATATSREASLEQDIATATTREASLESDIATANTVNGTLSSTIDTANATNTALGNTNSTANTTNTTLNTTISNANAKNTTLNSTIANANGTDSTLNTTIGEANTINNTLSNLTNGTIKQAKDINTTLNSTISTANSTNTTLIATNDTAVSTNTILNATNDTAVSTNTTLNSTIGTANTTDSTLNTSITNANTINNTLSNSTNGTIKQATDINHTLSNSTDGTIKTANDTNTTLNTTISTANTTNGTLNTTIGNADSKNTLLNSTITEANSMNNTLNNTINTASNTNTTLSITTVDANAINNTLATATTGTIAKAESINTTLIGVGGTVDTANATNTTLSNTIGTANSTNTTLNTTISNADSKNTTLNNTITTANSTNTTLSNTNSTANTTNSTLTTTVNNANSINDTLSSVGGTIETANSVNTTLNTTITEANSVNTTLNGSVVDGQNKIQQMDAKILEASNKISETETARLSVVDTENRFEVFESYNSTKTYYPLNKVTYNGSVYVCKVQCTGVVPTNTTNWLMVVTATDYTHPSTHSADMITESTSRKWVSPTEKTTWNGKQNALGFTPENSANKGVANGYTPLGSDGLIPNSYLPANVKEIKVVATITERNALTPYEGMRVHVVDASADATVTSGWAEYLYTGTAWTKTSEIESIDVVTSWADVQNKPTTLMHTNVAQTVAENLTIANTKKLIVGDGRSSLSGNGAVTTLDSIGSIVIQADNDLASATEFLDLRAGHNYARVKAGALDVNGLTYNGNIVYHAGNLTPLTLGETSTTAYRGDRGKIAYDHSQTPHNYETAFTKNTGFNKNFGTVAGTVAEGNHTHSDLHSHTNKTVLDGVTSTKVSNWDSAYTHSIASHLALGETSTTAYRGDRGKVAYDHSQTSHAYLPLSGGSLTGTVSFNDVSRYWLNTAGNWGLYWNTTDNKVEFHGAGVNRFAVDLDNGDVVSNGNITASGDVSGDAWKGNTTSTDWSQFVRNTTGEASVVYFNQVSTGRIVAFSSGTSTAGVGVVASVESDGSYSSQGEVNATKGFKTNEWEIRKNTTTGSLDFCFVA